MRSVRKAVSTVPVPAAVRAPWSSLVMFLLSASREEGPRGVPGAGWLIPAGLLRSEPSSLAVSNSRRAETHRTL